MLFLEPRFGPEVLCWQWLSRKLLVFEVWRTSLLERLTANYFLSNLFALTTTWNDISTYGPNERLLCNYINVCKVARFGNTGLTFIDMHYSFATSLK